MRERVRENHVVRKLEIEREKVRKRGGGEIERGREREGGWREEEDRT